jgi:hypothetical protein
MIGCNYKLGGKGNKGGCALGSPKYKCSIYTNYILCYLLIDVFPHPKSPPGNVFHLDRPIET